MSTEATFRERIRALRIEKFGTQERFAYKAGVSRATVQNWESGKHMPSLPEAVRLAELFAVSVDYLAGRVERITPEEAWALAADREAEALSPVDGPPSAPSPAPRSRPRREKPPAL